ncbi:MAG: hypothetical protein CM15mP74_08310 [Halieaceae bacterium]|nr:MAG: hypothetical protein CM15mP74_08310 [Halieaceae bacterium]
MWEDEFDGDALNSENWEPQIGDGSDYGLDRWGNGEQQWYLAENATVADGLLTITARSEEVVSGFPYTSAGFARPTNSIFNTVGLRCAPKPPWVAGCGQPFGCYPPIRLMALGLAAASSTLWKSSMPARRETRFLTAHHGFEWPLNQQAGMDVEVEGPGDGFHTYAIEWSDNLIHWFIDGEHHMTVGAEHYYLLLLRGHE